MLRFFTFFAFFFSLFCGYAQQENIHYHFLEDLQVPQVRKVFSIPDVLGYKTLKCDFHIHTIYSDGQVLPSVRVQEAWQEGLDVISITDHIPAWGQKENFDYNQSYREALPTAKRRGITLIQGIEYTGSKPVGHFNFLFIQDANKFLPKGNSISEEEALQTITAASKEGAFVIYNHPGWPDKNSDLFNLQYQLIKDGHLHGIEVFNGPEFYPVAIDYCKEYNLANTSATDIHGLVSSQYDLTRKHRNMTFVFAKENTQESIKEALFARRTLAFADPYITGDEGLLKELLKACIKVNYFKFTDNRWSAELENISDLHFTVQTADQEIIQLLPRSIVQMSDVQSTLTSRCKITNLYTGSGTSLVVPQAYLVTSKEEVAMPYVTQNTYMQVPGTAVILHGDTTSTIRYTLDSSEPTENSALYTQPFILKESALLKAKAFKNNQSSLTFRQQFILTTPLQSYRGKIGKQGVSYQYFEGNFSRVADMKQENLKSEGVMNSIDITQAAAQDHFGYIFSGYIYAPIDGSYTFATYSDDGSTLTIGNIELIDNDGSHSLTKVRGEIVLQKGYYRYELKYIEDYEGQELHLMWKTPGGKEEEIPTKYLFTKP